jgi:PHD/YefM family antitoxin component YafN of YafNO toxin-antitoxin module
VEGGIFHYNSKIIKASATIRQNYNEISNLCKTTKSPIYLTKNGEGDLVVMDIVSFDERLKQLELRETLLEVEENRRAGIKDFTAKEVSEELWGKLNARR